MRLENKVALITGGGSGIGRATSVLFAREGARIVVSDVGEDSARQTADEVEAAGGEAVVVTGDVSRTDDAKRWSTPRWTPTVSSTCWSTAPA